MEMRQPIDLHKGLTLPLMLMLMLVSGNWGPGPWLYLALHGGYGVLWVVKSRVFPDPAWQEEVPLWLGLVIFGALLLYWVAPVLLVTSGRQPPPWLMGLVTLLYVWGIFLHFVADAQKYYTLRCRRGLITNGLFSRTRNPNYLGEVMIYTSFAALSMHLLPFLILGLFFLVVFLPNMRKKERSLSRYPEWQAYVRRSGLLLPRVRLRG
jgi:steroid 5-alpha reductase family enzyme